MISKEMQEKNSSSSAIRRMFSEGKRLAKLYGEENVYDFSIGNPNLLPPKSLNTSILSIIDSLEPEQIHGQTSEQGIPEVRQRLAEYENRTKGTDLSQENIVMCYGAAGGLNVLFEILLDPGDEVVTFAPFFSEYSHYVSNHGGLLKSVPANPPTFQPDFKGLSDMITEKTRAVLINSPNNPTGVVYSEETIQGIAKILEAKEKELGNDIMLISDEPYREIVYTNEQIPYLLNYYKNSAVVYSYSKTLSVPGERIGYIALNPEMNELDLVLKSIAIANRILGFNSAPSLFQRVVAEIVDEKVDVDYYKRNRDVLCSVMDKKGLTYAKPDGTFYLFVKSPIEDDVLFCEKAKEYNILVVPMKGFACPGYFRISYCVSYEKVVASLDAFRELFDHFKL